jgi:hypothetical protein
MAKTAREQLAQLLDDSEPAGSFSAQLLAPAHLLQLEVPGVGPVNLPLRAPLAKKLIAVARPAMFGRGEETLADTSVRDTWELTPDQLTLGGPGWTALLDSALEQFRDELGLPRTSRLRTEPHSMLIYGKGQFFLPHQDSEKDDAMVGTLVVSLPSAHTGGDLIIDHAGESTTYRASKEELTHCLTEHFTTPATPRYSSRNLGLPNRLVFLLDHEYTQRGLNWRRLKGVDAERAALLRAAAEQAGCDTVLALAEVKETWDASSSEGDPWDDYHAEDAGPDDFELTELLVDEISLGWWTRPDGTGDEPISLDVPDHEVCATTPSASLEPYQSEYEGYMGNYGNTVDRWYRRAAIVVGPRDRAFAARAEAGSQWALHELRDRIDAGDLASAQAAAESLAPLWKKVGTQTGLLDATLAVAAGLGAAVTTAMLLEPFRVETVTQKHADGLAAAAGRYGQEWTHTVIDGWFGPDHRYGTDRAEATAGGGGRRQAARRDHRSAARGRGQHRGVPDAGTASTGCAKGGARHDRAGLRAAARHDRQTAGARQRRLVDRMDRMRMRPL